MHDAASCRGLLWKYTKIFNIDSFSSSSSSSPSYSFSSSFKNSYIFICSLNNHSLLLLLLLFYAFEFFTPARPNGLLLDFEWQQVFSNLQDSSQYSDRPQQCCCFYALHSTPHHLFPSPPIPGQILWLTVLSASITIDITVTFTFHWVFFRFLSKIEVFIFLLAFF